MTNLLITIVQFHSEWQFRFIIKCWLLLSVKGPIQSCKNFNVIVNVSSLLYFYVINLLRKETTVELIPFVTWLCSEGIYLSTLTLLPVLFIDYSHQSVGTNEVFCLRIEMTTPKKDLRRFCGHITQSPFTYTQCY